MNRLTHGVGVCEDGKFKRYIDNKQTREYTLWVTMLKRCYSSKFHKVHPQYVGCSASENFKDFQYFAEWCNNQVGFGKEGYQLDKDILIKGNRVYSEDTCVFVPRELNYFYIRKNVNRGAHPIGVCMLFGKFKAQICIGAKQTHLGLFDTELEAYSVYKSKKEFLAKNIAKTLEGLVDTRVIISLRSFKVELTD